MNAKEFIEKQIDEIKKNMNLEFEKIKKRIPFKLVELNDEDSKNLKLERESSFQIKMYDGNDEICVPDNIQNYVINSLEKRVSIIGKGIEGGIYKKICDLIFKNEEIHTIKFEESLMRDDEKHPLYNLIVAMQVKIQNNDGKISLFNSEKDMICFEDSELYVFLKKLFPFKLLFPILDFPISEKKEKEFGRIIIISKYCDLEIQICKNFHLFENFSNEEIIVSKPFRVKINDTKNIAKCVDIPINFIKNKYEKEIKK